MLLKLFLIVPLIFCFLSGFYLNIVVIMPSYLLFSIVTMSFIALFFPIKLLNMLMHLYHS